MMRSLKKNRKKGFTLVELIVVLVILAILAALLIPALTGYIDKAKEKQITAETRSCVMAAQTLADEKYAKGESLTDDDASLMSSVQTLAETPKVPTSLKFEGGKVKELVYTDGSKTCTYTYNTTTKEGKYEIS